MKESRRFRRYCRKLTKIVSEPIFVKIGANDGITSDPCSDILLGDSNWKGVLIEPVPYCFDRLKEHFGDARRFHLERVAIGREAGQTDFYYVDAKAKNELPDLPEWFDQLGSFDRNHIVKHLDGVLEPFIVQTRVQVSPLSAVLERNRVKNVHLLHVDTEGYDFEIVKSIDFERHAPLSIYAEHKHLRSDEKSEMADFLCDRGYSVRDCGTDYFAVLRYADQLFRRNALVQRGLELVHDCAGGLSRGRPFTKN
jgi:FkbM family methyltransferase